MFPELVSIAWLNWVLLAFLFGFGFRVGARLADGLLDWALGLFRHE